MDITLADYLDKSNYYQERFSEESECYYAMAVEELQTIDKGALNFISYRHAAERALRNELSMGLESEGNSGSFLKRVLAFFINLVHFIAELFRRIGRFIMKMINRFRSMSAAKRIGKNNDRVKGLTEEQVKQAIKDKGGEVIKNIKIGGKTLIKLDDFISNIKGLNKTPQEVDGAVQRLNADLRNGVTALKVGKNLMKILKDSDADLPLEATNILMEKYLYKCEGDQVEASLNKYPKEIQAFIRSAPKVDKEFVEFIGHSYGRSDEKSDDGASKRVTEYEDLERRALSYVLPDVPPKGAMGKLYGMDYRKNKDIDTSKHTRMIKPRTLALYSLFGVSDMHKKDHDEVKVSEYFNDENNTVAWYKICAGKVDSKSNVISKELVNMLEKTKTAEKKWSNIEKGSLKEFVNAFKEYTNSEKSGNTVKVYTRIIRSLNAALDSYRNVSYLYSSTRMYAAIVSDQFIKQLSTTFRVLEGGKK